MHWLIQSEMEYWTEVKAYIVMTDIYGTDGMQEDVSKAIEL